MSVTLGLILSLITSAFSANSSYSPRGVGGGGAMAGLSISPYSDLRFVGTDMGTLFRSDDKGSTWHPIHHTQVRYNSDLTVAADVGFSSNPQVVFFADAGKNPKRSKDGGYSWAPIAVPLSKEERIRYWLGDAKDPKFMLCATTEGLLKSTNQGETWKRISGTEGYSRGTSVLVDHDQTRIFHANDTGIFVSDNHGESFRKWYTPAGTQIRAFAGGSDSKGLTLSFIDTAGKEACRWAESAGDSEPDQKAKTVEECGYVWIFQHSGKSLATDPDFKKTKKEGGRFIRMAENDSQTIYVTGGDWVRQYGSKVWVSRNAGKNWVLALQLYDWDQHPYKPWSKDKLEYSPPGVDVGWDDNAPYSFAINLRKPSEVGSTGNYFLHITEDFGDHWKAPFTHFADKGERTKGKTWQSTGLEVTSALRMKFHPNDSKLGYVSLADLGGYVTEDGGQSYRISKAKYNTNYDYAFDPAKKDRVFAASGNRHDFPVNINTPIVGEGGIFVSDNRGRSWKRLTPEGQGFNRQFLSVAYDAKRKTLYGGTQGGGIARSTDDGKNWKFFNTGFDPGDQVIPQLEIDPKDGTVYALLTGNAPEFRNAGETGIYRYQPEGGTGHWELLRKTVNRPKEVDTKYALWQFPSAFAVDFSNPGRKVLWLTDIENKGAWLATGVWKSTDGGNTWNRMTQFTHPMSVTIDKSNSNRVVVSGLWDVTGGWGQGGALITNDGGKSWKKNEKLPLQANVFNFTPDPKSPSNGFYLFFGGGILYGPVL